MTTTQTKLRLMLEQRASKVLSGDTMNSTKLESRRRLYVSPKAKSDSNHPRFVESFFMGHRRVFDALLGRDATTDLARMSYIEYVKFHSKQEEPMDYLASEIKYCKNGTFTVRGNPIQATILNTQPAEGTATVKLADGSAVYNVRVPRQIVEPTPPVPVFAADLPAPPPSLWKRFCALFPQNSKEDYLLAENQLKHMSAYGWKILKLCELPQSFVSNGVLYTYVIEMYRPDCPAAPVYRIATDRNAAINMVYDGFLGLVRPSVRFEVRPIKSLMDEG